MSTRIEKTVVVNVPVSTVYNQWTQFEELPRFMGGVTSVRQLTDDRLERVAEIGGVRRAWEARILEQVPDRKIAWAATEGSSGAARTADDDDIPFEAGRAGADSHIPEQPLGVDAPLEEHPAPPLDVPPVDMPDTTSSEDGRSGVDPVTGRPVDDDRPAGGML